MNGFDEMDYEAKPPERAPELLEVIAALINANERLRVNLESNAMILKQALLRLQEGMDVGEVLPLLPSKGQRTASEDVLANLVSRRRLLGEVLVIAALDSGIAVDELAQQLEETPEVIRAIADSPLRL
jgi:hypothetical protein